MSPSPIRRISPTASVDRHWTGNDASGFHHHGVVALSESPLTLSLQWRVDEDRKPTLVGFFRIDLAALLDGDFIRRDGVGNVRLRFIHAGDGGVYIQRNLSGPRLLVGRV